MTPVEFFDLFNAELLLYPRSHYINTYYKFARKGPLFGWRKAYFIQRLEYIYANVVQKRTSEPPLIWDVGCGFGTSALFLAMNGVRTSGLTIESYHTIIPDRKKYWRKFGDADLFTYEVGDLFDTNQAEGKFDFILVQDALHHIEPIGKGISILYKNLKEDGKLIVVDENGNNVILRAMLYKMRGNNRVIEVFDSNLNRNLLLGNENVRSLNRWKDLIEEKGFNIGNIQYIKFFPPYLLNEKNYRSLNMIEQKWWRKYSFLREGFYWGLNFVGIKHRSMVTASGPSPGSV